MTGLRTLMLMGVAGLALLMAPDSNAAYTSSEAGYHGSQINANFRPTSSLADAFVGDDGHTAFVLPFAFEFYGHAYAAGSLGWISSNGLLGFDAANAGDYCCHGTFSFSSPTNTVLAGWFDMFGTVYTQTDGTPGNRELVFTWDGNEYDDFSAGARNRFQVILHEGSNDIEFQYDQLNSLLHYASVGGIKGGELTEGLNFVDFTENVSLANVGLLISTRQVENVPEPGSAALPGLGLAGLALARKKAALGGMG